MTIRNRLQKLERLSPPSPPSLTEAQRAGILYLFGYKGDDPRVLEVKAEMLEWMRKVKEYRARRQAEALQHG